MAAISASVSLGEIGCLVLGCRAAAAAQMAVALKRRGATVRTCGDALGVQKTLESEHIDLAVLCCVGDPDVLRNSLRRIAAAPRRLAVVVRSRVEDLAVVSDIGRLNAVFVTEDVETELLVDIALAATVSRAPESSARAVEQGMGPVLRFASEHKLTSRQVDVLNLLLAGQAPKEMAEPLGISYGTVRYHATSMYRKCNCRTQRELLALLANAGLRAEARRHGASRTSA